MNQNKYQSLCVAELPITSHEAIIIQNELNESVISNPKYFKEKWQCLRVFNIDNQIFNRDFNEKRCSFQEKSCLFNQWDVRYGFLTTIRESMIHKVADEGLEVRLCPYNYFGHSISGIHISQNADVCMNEALSKIGPADEIILIIFKYMLGRHKLVPMYDPDILLAPTPKYDSHLCAERPDPTENINDQYIKSLVYLYEFENVNFDPTIRPRHCCPVSALIFKQARPYNYIDITANEPVHSRISIYDERPLSLMKPVSQPHWGREFILKPPLPNTSMVIHKNERDDSRKVIVPNVIDNGNDFRRRPVDENNQRWEPIKYEFYEPDIGDDRNRIVMSRSRTRRDVIDTNRHGPDFQERDRSFDRVSTVRDDIRYPNNVSTYGRDNFLGVPAPMKWIR